MDMRCKDAIVQTKTRVPRTMPLAASSAAASRSRLQSSRSADRQANLAPKRRNSSVPGPTATRRRSRAATSPRARAQAACTRRTSSSRAACCSSRKRRLQGPRLSGLPSTVKGRCRRTARSFSQTASTAWFVTHVTQAIRPGGTRAESSPKIVVLLPVPGGPWMTSRRCRRPPTALRWGAFSSCSARESTPPRGGWKLPGLALAGARTIARSSRSATSPAPRRAAA
mmetsp:Transcript_18804/g.59000  ORF Transcript_18804/g.59000 Transcript_18804/m.59000 type:complete len:226 (+) Transcript_18804:360-1037(+)